MKIYTTPRQAHAIRITADIVTTLPRDIDKKTVVFCESKATLSFEREILNRLGGTFNTEVMSFSRYVAKNVKVEGYLSKAQSALLVRKLMLENEESLYKLKPHAFSVPTDVYGLISQLKAAMVKPCDLKDVAEKENGTFKTKLKDIATVYSLYEDYLKKENLTDENGYLSLMSGTVKNDDTLKGANVIVACIQSYTKQTLNIIKALNKVSNLTFVCVSADYASFTNESVNKITEIFKSAEIIPVREEDKDVQYSIGKWLFEPVVPKEFCRYSDKIRITEASSIKEECDRIAARIRYEVVNNGRRYRDFSVIAPDVKTILPFLKESFFLYDIPLYAQDSKTLDEHPVIGLIGGLIDVKRFNFLPKKAALVAKNGLLCSFGESLEFVRYLNANAVSRSLMHTPFCNLIAESVRNRIVENADKFNASDSVSSYIDCVNRILSDLDVYNRGQTLSDGLNDLSEGVTAEFNDGALRELPVFLEEIKQVVKDAKVSLIEFKNILISGAKAVNIATIPEYNDTVFVGDYQGGRIKESKILFMPSLTSLVPSYKADNALINDRELIKMEGYKLVIEPKLQIVQERERENIAVAMMGFTDKLFLSYPVVDSHGKQILKSEIIDCVKEIFSDEEKKLNPIAMANSEIKSNKLLLPFNFMSQKSGVLYAAKKAEEFRDRKTDDVLDLACFLETQKDTVDSKKVVGSDESFEVFNEKLSYSGKFSPTQIENYFDCPYKAFAQNILKLRESDDGETKVYEIGNVLHAVMENFVSDLNGEKDEQAIKKTVEKIFDEEVKKPLYARYLNKPQYQTMFALLKDEAVKECTKIYFDIQKSDFKPLGAEIEFNEHSSGGYKPIYLKTDAGSIPVRGKIDRTDVYRSEGENYFRIIDYKTGNIKSEDYELYSGKKIQLYLYMNVFTQKGFKPAGAHYLKLSSDYSSDGGDGCEYLGKTLADREIIGHLDKDFTETNESKDLGVKVLRNGTLSGVKTTLSKEEFDKYVKYALSVAESGVDEMNKGCFIPSPCESSCDYCSYKGMCGYDVEVDNSTRDTKKANKSSIIYAEENND